MHVHQWLNINYLLQGTPAQVEVYKLLKKHFILEHMQGYNPILVGTVPLGIHVKDSDLDIICEVTDFTAFKHRLIERFHTYSDFIITDKVVSGIRRMKANFMCEGWPIEIFGQAISTINQNGYRHMVIEARILELFGDSFREQIVALKRNGMKTEPAFTQALHIDGDPYERLLELYHWTDEQILELKR